MAIAVRVYRTRREAALLRQTLRCGGIGYRRPSVIAGPRVDVQLLSQLRRRDADLVEAPVGRKICWPVGDGITVAQVVADLREGFAELVLRFGEEHASAGAFRERAHHVVGVGVPVTWTGAEGVNGYFVVLRLRQRLFQRSLAAVVV